MTEPPPVTAEDIVLRDQSFRLLRIASLQAAAVERRLSTCSGSFRFATLEEDGLTLLLSADDLSEIGDLANGADIEPDPYRVITFQQDMAWTVVGFLHRVCAVLAEESIPLGAISAFARDHLFIRADLSDRAVKALRQAATDGRLA